MLERKKGFSLLELVISLGISSIICIVLASIIFQTYKTLEFSNKEANYGGLEFALDYMEEDISSADGIIPMNGGIGFYFIKNSPTRTSYITYKIEGENLYRLAFEDEPGLINLTINSFSYRVGKNLILQSSKSISNSLIDKERGILHLEIENEKHKLYRDLALRWAYEN